MLSCSVMSNSVWPAGLSPGRLLCPWNPPGKNTGVGCDFLFQGISPTQGLNPHLLHLLHWQVGSLLLMPLGSPQYLLIWLCWVLVKTCGIFHCPTCYLVSWAGIEPGTPAPGVWSLKHSDPMEVSFWKNDQTQICLRCRMTVSSWSEFKVGFDISSLPL